jgi:hypothetical protein
VSGEHRLPACWFESLAIASRPLQRQLAETAFPNAKDIIEPTFELAVASI